MGSQKPLPLHCPDTVAMNGLSRHNMATQRCVIFYDLQICLPSFAQAYYFALSSDRVPKAEKAAAKR